MFYFNRKNIVLNCFTGIFFYLPPALVSAGEIEPLVTDFGVFELSGFGTVAAVYHTKEGVEFQRDIGQGHGAKANKISFKPDTMLGLQLTHRLNSHVESSIQAVQRQNAHNQFKPEVAWAYLKIKPVEQASIRVGRLGLEVHMQGDSAEIDFANLLVRQPIIYYPRMMNGVDVEYIDLVKSGTLRLKGFIGKTVGELNLDGSNIVDVGGGKIFAGIAEYNYGNWTTRLIHGQLKFNKNIFSILSDELNAGFDQVERLTGGTVIATNREEINNRISTKGRKVRFQSITEAYDAGSLQAMLAYTTLATKGWVTQKAFFGHFGYRLDSFTPFISYAQIRTNRNFISAGFPEPALADPNIALLDNSAALAQSLPIINQSRASIGTRISLHRNVALKFQLERIRYKDPEALLDKSLLEASPLNRSFKNLSVFSAALNFVF